MLNRLRSLSAFVTYITLQMLTDPGGLKTKIVKKIAGRVPEHRPMSKAELAEDLGEYSLAIELSNLSWLRPIYSWRHLQLRLRCRNQLAWLRAPISLSTREPSTMPTEDISTVLYICGNSQPYTYSGYSERTQHLLEAIQASGIQVIAQTRLNYPAEIGVPLYSAHSVVNGVRYFRNTHWLQPLDVRRYIKLAAAGIVRLAEESGAGVLHTTTGFQNAVVVSAAASNLGRPWVYEMRGELEKTWLTQSTASGHPRSPESEHFRLWRSRELDAARKANGVVVLSKLTKKSLVERGIEPSKIVIAPNSVDEEVFRTEIRAEQAKIETATDLSKVTIGTISSIVNYEGLDTLILALKHMPENYQVLIVGDGTDRSRLMDIARKAGLATRVRFPGQIPEREILKWYKSLDVFVVPRNDTPVCRSVTPLKPMNAMALGIPVVASDLPALREVTGGHAVFVEPGQPELLAKSIVTAVNEVERTAEARNWVTERRWTEVGNRLTKFYAKVAEVGDE